MPTVAINGTVRHFDVEGAGPAVILVHGSVSNSRQWRKLVERLRNRYRLMAADLHAGEAGVAFTFVEDCDLVDHLVDGAAGKVYLVGHSYGGAIALKTALARRDRLAGLILIEPSCFHLLDRDGFHREHAEIAGLRARQQEALLRDEPDASARAFLDYWMGPRTWAEMPEPRRAAIRTGMPKVVQDWIGAFDGATRIDDIRSLDVPTLLMRAKDTKTPSSRIVDLMCEALPASRLVEIKQGGHMSPLTNPEPVNAAIEDFLDRRT